MSSPVASPPLFEQEKILQARIKWKESLQNLAEIFSVGPLYIKLSNFALFIFFVIVNFS